MKWIFRRLLPLAVPTVLVLFLTSCATHHADTSKNYSGAAPLEWSVRLADSELSRRGDSLNWKPGGRMKWDYAAGLFELSLLQLSAQVHDPRYQNFSQAATSSFISPDGDIQTYNAEEYQLDAINSGKNILALWQLTGEPRYQKAAARLRAQLNTQPRTFDGGFWHKQRYTNQMWLDGIYMASPFYAEYAKIFNELTNFDDVALQIRLIDQHCYNAKTGLYYHGWDATKSQFWANPITGCSSNFWGRADGWYAMALVDVLDYFPADHPARPQIIAILNKLAAAVVKYQDPKTGLWWQVMDQGDRKGNYLEATASSMFVYALAKGVNRGYLPHGYLSTAERGYAGIVRDLIHDDGGEKWSLTQCCSVAGLGGSPSNGKPRDGSFDYYVGEPIAINDFKGLGPFILAGIELYHQK
jgi:unsaturated rhamnogalacturonyl hydrolase